jgi:N-acetylglutamate synthase-like GNAT family acetyltransferase
MTATLIERAPTLAEYRALCTAVGWAEIIDFEAAPASLERSLFGVVAVDDGRVIGMGRLVGDGALYFYVQDVAVDPAYQHEGVGEAIVARLVAHVRARVTREAFVALFAVAGTEPFYGRHGFERRDQMVGMFQVVRREPSGPRAADAGGP